MDYLWHGGGFKGSFSMTDIQELFRRQAAWQKEQRSLTWAEKIRMVEAVRESILALRASAKDSKSPNQNSIN